MNTGGALEVGSVITHILADYKEFEKGFQKSLKIAEKAGQQLQAIGKKATMFLTVPLAGAGFAAVKAASDAEETASKFSVVFSSIIDDANNMADELDRSYGLSAKASKQLLSDTGDLLTGFGFAQDSALDLSIQVQRLAVDLASFTNYSGGAAGASQALTKALLGERESVKQLGIVIVEEDVKAKVLELTKQGLTFATERQAKAYATLQIAMEQSKNAIGDYALTSDSLANQTKELMSDLNDLAVELGTILIPVVKDIVATLKDWVEYFKELSVEKQTLIVNTGALLAVLGPLALALSAVVTIGTALVTVYKAAAIAVTTLKTVSLSALYTYVAATLAPLLANPATWGVLAIGTFIYWVKKSVDELNTLYDKIEDGNKEIMRMEAALSKAKEERKKKEEEAVIQLKINEMDDIQKEIMAGQSSRMEESYADEDRKRADEAYEKYLQDKKTASSGNGFNALQEMFSNIKTKFQDAKKKAEDIFKTAYEQYKKEEELKKQQLANTLQNAQMQKLLLAENMERQRSLEEQANRTEFKQIDIAKMAIAGPSNTFAKEDKVKAVGVETRLDKMINLLRQQLENPNQSVMV